MALRHTQSCKELIQTVLRCSTAEREQKTTKQRKSEENPLLFLFLHSTGEYEHMISHMLHPPPSPSHLAIHIHTHGCESAQKHCGVHPGPSQPNFPATPIQAPCPHRLSYKTPPTLRPTQSPLQSLKPALPPVFSTPVQSTQASAPSIALAGSLGLRMNGPETQEL